MTIQYKCDKCDKIFNHKNDYRKHITRKNKCTSVNKGTKFTQNPVNIIENDLICPNCNKSFSRNDSLKRHIANFCNVKNNIDTNTVLDKYDIVDDLSHINIYDDDIVDVIEQPIKSKPTKNTHINSTHHKKTHLIYKCEYCEKIYSRKDSLTRHINGFCKKKNEKESQNEKDIILLKLLKEMEEQKSLLLNQMQNLKNELAEVKKNTLRQASNTQNTNTQNNINNQNTIINNNNIKLIAFGKEDLENNITEEDCKKLLFKGFEALPALVEHVHFNKNKPQFHNCYISNMRDKYAVIYDGNQWKLETIDEVIGTLKDNKNGYLERKFEEFYDTLDNVTKKKFHRFLAEQDSDAVNNRHKKSMIMMLYNKRGIVIDTRNKFDETKKITL